MFQVQQLPLDAFITLEFITCLEVVNLTVDKHKYFSLIPSIIVLIPFNLFQNTFPTQTRRRMPFQTPTAASDHQFTTATTRSAAPFHRRRHSNKLRRRSSRSIRVAPIVPPATVPRHCHLHLTRVTSTRAVLRNSAFRVAAATAATRCLTIQSHCGRSTPPWVAEFQTS